MAETAGLVLGGIALVGLVSTCVEIAEYLESAKNRATDFRMALTKVNLIKERLRAWGAALPVDTPHDPQSNHTFALTGCGLLIEETLSGSRLPSEKLLFRSHSVISDISLPTDSGASFGTSLPRLPQPLLSFPLKVLWIFQDRKRFDDVIEQLDFLLSNLEKISETLQGRREMAQNKDSKQCPPFSGVKHETQEEFGHRSAEVMDVDIDEDSEELIVGTLLKSPGQSLKRQSCHNQSDSSSPDTTTLSKQPHPGVTELPSPSQTSEQSKDDSEIQGKSVIHQIIDNKAFDDAVTMQGDLGGTPQGVRGHLFKNNDGYDDSLVMLGSVTTEYAVQVLKTKNAGKGKGKAAPKRAAGASSARGVTKK